jgi:hypothetical protein
MGYRARSNTVCADFSFTHSYFKKGGKSASSLPIKLETSPRVIKFSRLLFLLVYFEKTLDENVFIMVNTIHA